MLLDGHFDAITSLPGGMVAEIMLYCRETTYKIVFSWVDLKHLKIGQMGYRVFDPEALAIMIILMY